MKNELDIPTTPESKAKIERLQKLKLGCQKKHNLMKKKWLSAPSFTQHAKSFNETWIRRNHNSANYWYMISVFQLWYVSKYWPTNNQRLWVSLYLMVSIGCILSYIIILSVEGIEILWVSKRMELTSIHYRSRKH